MKGLRRHNLFTLTGLTSLGIEPDAHILQNSVRPFNRSSSTADVPHCSASFQCAERNPEGPAEEPSHQPMGMLK